MRQLLFVSLALIFFTGCRKDHDSRVEIYLLRSFTPGVDMTTIPASQIITNAVLADAPLVTDRDIRFYTKATSTFTLRKNIQPIIRNYGPDKAFAVTVDRQVIYYGKFHPLYLSSFTYGLATISPFLYRENELRIDFINLTGTMVAPPDKRNDPRIINALRTTGRLR